MAHTNAREGELRLSVAMAYLEGCASTTFVGSQAFVSEGAAQ